MVCGGYALCAMASGHLKGADYHRVLPKSHHSLAHALETDWKTEQEELSSQKFDPLQKLPIAESAHSCMTSPLLDAEEAFRQKKGECEDYVKAISQAIEKYFLSSEEKIMAPLRTFVDKYSQVPRCVETWTLQEIEWIYTDEAQKEAKADMNGIAEHMKAARDFNARQMEPLQKFKSQSEMIKTHLASCEMIMFRVDEMVRETGVIATYIAFTDIARNPGLLVEDPQRVEKVDKYTVKHFGRGKDALPDTLKDALKAAAKEAKEHEKAEEKDKEKEKEKRQPKESKSKETKSKDKKEKKTKEEKKRSKDGEPGDDTDGGKHGKKSKKSKKSR